MAAHEKGLDLHEHDEPAYPGADALPRTKDDGNKMAIITDMGSFEYYGKPLRAQSNVGFTETNLAS